MSALFSSCAATRTLPRSWAAGAAARLEPLDPLLALGAAALQLLMARWLRTATAPVLLREESSAARHPLLIETAQPPEAAASAFLSSVVEEFMNARAAAFYLDTPLEHLPPEIAGIAASGTVMLSIAAHNPQHAADRSAGATAYPGLRIVLSRDAHSISASVDSQGQPSVPPEPVRRLLAWLLSGMHWLAEHPETPIREFCLLERDELERVLTGADVASRAYPRASLVELLNDAAMRHATRPAVRFDRNELTFEQLARRSNQVAHLLLSHGLPESRRVAVMLPASAALPCALLGVIKTGAAYVPLDPEMPWPRTLSMLRDAGVDLILTTAALDKAGASQDGVRCVLVEHADALPSGDPGVRIGPDDAAYVIFTSGSTGRPKGVEVAHGNLVNFCNWRIAEYGIVPSDVTLSVLSYAFDGFVSSFFPTLLAGGCVVLAPDHGRRDARYLCDVLRDGITNLALVPTILEALAAVATAADFAFVRWLVIGGEKPSRARMAAFETKFPHIRIVNEYGPTETTVACIVNSRWSSSDPLNVGRPVANTQVLILDQNLQPVPGGFPGEICVAGDGVAKGYVGERAASGGSFLAHARVRGGRFYRTGDLARANPDGTIELLGRMDSQLKLHGHRVELEEIEHAIAEHHQVLDAAVIPLGPKGRATALCAYLVGKGTVDSQQLIEHLTMRLPGFMIPQQFVQIDAIPLTVTGKKDRAALSSCLPPSVERAEELDSELAGIVVTAVGNVLHMHKDLIDTDMSFFQLGGDSIRMVMMQRILAREVGVEIPLVDLLSEPTLASLVRHVERARDAAPEGKSDTRLVRLGGGHGRRPFFFVHDVSGEISVYSRLSRALPAEFEYWGLRARRLSGLAPLEVTIAQLADQYAAEIGSATSSDTLFVGGWSVGGAIAFEIAGRLERQGRRVGALVLIDPPQPGVRASAVAPGDAGSERRWILANVAHPVGELAERVEAGTAEQLWAGFAARIEAARFSEQALLAALPEQIARIVGKYHHSGSAAIIGHVSTVRTIADAWQRYDLAAADPVDTDTILVRPTASVEGSATAWSACTRGSFTVSPVPGDHWSMFVGANANALGAAIGASLAGTPDAAACG